MTQVLTLSLKDYTHGSAFDKQQFAHQFFDGLQDCGFVVLVDHPVNVELLEQAYRESAKFFSRPESEKLTYIHPEVAGQRGYTPFGREHAKNSQVADLKEFWHIGREVVATHPLKSFFPDNIWPRSANEFSEVFQPLFASLDDTGRIMLQALTEPLGLQKDYFTRMTDTGSSILRLLHYPPLSADRDPNSVRAAAHEDINLITLLPSASASGLELLSRDGEWLPVEAPKHALIVDSGDMLARITNDVIPSTTHRVVNPKGPNTSRYSMPFFMHPNPDALLTCIPSCLGTKAKYEDISANEFLFQRLREIGLAP